MPSLPEYIEAYKQAGYKMLFRGFDSRPNEASNDCVKTRSGAPRRSASREAEDKEIMRKWAIYKAEGRSKSELACDLSISVARIERARHAERKAKARAS